MSGKSVDWDARTYMCALAYVLHGQQGQYVDPIAWDAVFATLSFNKACQDVHERLTAGGILSGETPEHDAKVILEGNEEFIRLILPTFEPDRQAFYWRGFGWLAEDARDPRAAEWLKRAIQLYKSLEDEGWHQIAQGLEERLAEIPF